MALDKVTTGVIADDAITSEQLGVGAIAGSDIAANVIEVKPHIKPGILQPAVAGKLLDGTTNHSGAYGTAQSDGHSYYYTDIKGSKAIKDPRIGAHFGSQRNMFKSLQLLEQETATHGSKVFSIDGREWLKAVDSSGTWVVQNNTAGNYIEAAGGNCTGNFIEITGYFNDINFSFYTHSNRCDDIDISVNGTLSVDGSTTLGGKTTVESPLGGRYVNASSFINGGSTLSTSLGTTPKINTIRYEAKTGSSEYISINGIDLIAQDTTSTANKSKIQIPSQNVVSYGKKFTVSGTPHYNPFDGMSGAKTLAQLGDYIDTATSLGMDNWKAGTSNYYKPFNGGRVVKWVDSSGTIKTSVTMMPPNAQNIGGTASNAVSDAHIQAGTNDDTINFDTNAIDHSLSEVAKTFHWREFGNGAANGGTGGSYADFSMLATTADIVAYVMDDGLTSFSAEDTLIDGTANADFLIQNGHAGYITFIGTGISFRDVGTAEAGIPDGTYSINLPYGTHIFKYLREDTNQDEIYLDGIKIKDPAGTTGGYFGSKDFTFHQPKKPPVPEDACIIADYMLMADYVQNTANGNDKISKGVRICSQSRDVHYKEQNGFIFSAYDAGAQPGMGYLCSNSNTSNTDQNEYTLPAFGTTFQINGHTSQSANDLHIDDTDVAQSGTTDGNHGDISYPDAAVELGLHKFGVHGLASNDYSPYIGGLGFKIATPIHTSSHYQSFETPFLKELVGGDRNMEQNNLVVTPDGKTWDEVTRDTSYIGKIKMTANIDQNSTDSDYWWLMDNFRGDWTQHGNANKGGGLGNKDFAIAYDRVICLVDGQYKIETRNYNSSAGKCGRIYVNGSEVSQGVIAGGDHGYYNMLNTRLFRGDYVQVRGEVYSNSNYYNFNFFNITKL